ncbi:hypothetical protein IFO70_15775 [Phormidium tenue FACHB-886]|nr:hypothetical protein [Phormidium tenue FACHB-886]
MLSQIVRPMVRTQLRLLANSQATRTTLITTIAQWLSFLGVQAKVTHLDTAANEIQVSLTVSRPDACDTRDWQQILHNLEQTEAASSTQPSELPLSASQERKLQRLLAYVVQVGDPNTPVDWERLYPQLQSLGFTEDMLLGIKAAAKVPQTLEQLVDGLDADVAAIALSKAVGIALLDRQVNPLEDKALVTLLEAMKH